MAGFDFDFKFADEHAAYVHACLRAAKSRARRLKCQWRIETLEQKSALRCVVGGPSRNLDLLGRSLEHDLPTVCEGVNLGLSPQRARRLGLGFADLYLLGRDMELGDQLSTLRPRTATSLYYSAYDFSETGRGSVTLRARLRLTEDVVTDYGLGRYPSVVVLEELHTALEQTLRELSPTAKRNAKWPQLLAAAEAAGHLDLASDRGGLTREKDHGHTDFQLLESLTLRRNTAKHRGGDLDDNWMSEHWECVSILLERLVSRLP